MKDKVFLVLYIAAVILITSVHDLTILATVLAIAVVLSGKHCWKIASKALFTILAFNSIVTVPYVVMTFYQGGFSAYYVALINMRVFLLTFLTFLLVRRINPFVALGFSKSLVYLLTLAYSQVLTLRRLFEEFYLALKSRSLKRLSIRDLYSHGAATIAFFLQKSFNDAHDIAQAMKSRGFFND